MSFGAEGSGKLRRLSWSFMVVIGSLLLAVAGSRGLDASERSSIYRSLMPDGRSTMAPAPRSLRSPRRIGGSRIQPRLGAPSDDRREAARRALQNLPDAQGFTGEGLSDLSRFTGGFVPDSEAASRIETSPQLLKSLERLRPSTTTLSPGSGEVVESFTEASPPLNDFVEAPLESFGYAFFREGSKPLSLPAVTDSPAGYRLGPGDAFSIHIFSKVIDENYSAQVNAQGRIVVPRAGELYVSGIRYGDLNDFLKTEFSKFMKEIEVSTLLTRLRTFPVVVSGEVQSPGVVLVNALSTPLTALLQAKGPTQRGSLRQIKVLRGAGEEDRVDLYDLLIRGEPPRDVYLNEGDVVFVPVVGSTVGIYGKVRRPAIYELLPGETAADLVSFAGGLSPGAYGSLVQIVRTQGQSRRVWLDVNLGRRRDALSALELQDGDVLFVPEVTRFVRNTVEIRGNVMRPGKFQWRRGMRVHDLLELAEGTLPQTFMERGEIIRTLRSGSESVFNPPVRSRIGQQAISVNLTAAMARDPEHDVLLDPLDILIVYREDEVLPRSRATVTGEVARPGEFDLMAGMRISDLVYRAGGVTRRADLSRVELSRRQPDGRLEVIPVDLGRILDGDESEDYLLQNQDILAIYTSPIRRDRVRVTISGLVVRPGAYEMTRGQRLSDLVERAGGFLDGAFLPGAVFTRESVRKRQEEERDEFVRNQRRKLLDARLTLQQPLPASADRILPGANPGSTVASLKQTEELLASLQGAEVTGRVTVEISEFESFKGSSTDFVLDDGDALEVPRQPAEILVTGEVQVPGAFVFGQNKTVRDYLKIAGGLTGKALREEIFLVRADGRAISPKSFEFGRWDGIHISRNRRKNFFSVVIEPGDQIVVPFDLAIKIDQTSRNLSILVQALSSFSLLSRVILDTQNNR